jgi:hypothetical protein
MDIQIGRQDRYQDRMRAAGVVDELGAHEAGGCIDDDAVDVVGHVDRAGTARGRGQGMDLRQRIGPVSQPVRARALTVHVEQPDLPSRRGEISGQAKGESRLPRSTFRIEDDDFMQFLLTRQFEQRPTPLTPNALNCYWT